MVDAHGRVYNGDELLYAVVRERLLRGPVAGVVGTLMTNFGFEKQIKALGIPFERAQVRGSLCARTAAQSWLALWR